MIFRTILPQPLFGQAPLLTRPMVTAQHLTHQAILGRIAQQCYCYMLYACEPSCHAGRCHEASRRVLHQQGPSVPHPLLWGQGRCAVAPLQVHFHGPEAPRHPPLWRRLSSCPCPIPGDSPTPWLTRTPLPSPFPPKHHPPPTALVLLFFLVASLALLLPMPCLWCVTPDSLWLTPCTPSLPHCSLSFCSSWRLL